MTHKILLVNPPPLDDQTYGQRILYPPLGLGYLAAVLIKDNYDVSILDANALEYTLGDILKFIKDYKPNFIGLTSTTGKLDDIFFLCKEIKNFDKNIKILVGGSHPTQEPGSVIKSDYVDFVISGEAEYAFPELIKGVINGKDISSIKGVGYKKDGKIIVNGKADMIKNLDDLPMPAYHLFPMEKYTSVQSSKSNIMIMMTSRGCPYQCTFCAVPKLLGYRYRYVSAERVVEEMEYLKNNFGIGEIHFKDSIFNLNIPRINKICDLLIEKKLNMTWLCNARVDGISTDNLERMKKAGCISITYGIESGSDRILKRLKKGFNRQLAISSIKLTNKIGIDTTANYIIGNPDDTRRTINETIDFAIEANTDFANFNFLAPLPGTEIWDEAVEKNWFIGDYDVNDIRYDRCSINATDIPTEELNKYLKIAYNRFYFRPAYILKRLKRLSIHDIKTNYHGLKAILKMRTNGVAATN